jgi:hypothetical protein
MNLFSVICSRSCIKVTVTCFDNYVCLYLGLHTSQKSYIAIKSSLVNVKKSTGKLNIFPNTYRHVYA